MTIAVMGRTTTLKICLILFAVSFGIRVLVWQNNKIAMDEVQNLVTIMYQGDAITLASGDLPGFLTGPNPPYNATILAHPPGYPLLMAPVFAVFGENLDLFRVLQILLCSLAPIIIFFITFELFDRTTAIVAASLAALSPQASYYAGILLPDGLCVVPILAAVYFFTRATKNPRLLFAAATGILLAASCWLRSNAMLMPLFFLLAAFFVLPKGVRLRFATTLLSVFLLAIAPITIRNAVIFKSLIPLSLGMGHMIVIGLGEYDNERKLGLPTTDNEETALDARRDERPDYYGQLYDPDGVRREKERTRLGLNIIKSDPAWYLSIVARRSLMIPRMERVPVIAAERDENDTTPTIFYIIDRPLRYLQKIFITAVFLPLFLFGLAIMLRDKKQHTSALLLSSVPVYYICVQSLIYTEYRFVLAVPHFVLIVSAVALSFLIKKLAGLLPGLGVKRSV